MVELRGLFILVHVALRVYHVLDLTLMVLRGLEAVWMLSVVRERRDMVTDLLMSRVAHPVRIDGLNEAFNLDIGIMALEV